MSKLIPFKKNAVYYYERALAASDKNDFIGCLKLLRYAAELVEDPFSDDDLAIRLEIADTLGLMGLYNESTKLYLRLTAFDYCLDDIYYGIIKNYVLLDMHEEAAYYLNYAIEEGILSQDDGFEPIDFQEAFRSEIPRLRLYKKGDNSHTLYLAKKLLGSSDTRYARQMLASIPETSDQYPEAANYLALLEVSEENFTEGHRLLDNILTKNGGNVAALTTRIIALDMEGRAEEAAESAAALDAMGITEWPECAKVALCFCQIGSSEPAKRYLALCLKHVAFDRDMTLLYALACSNTGDQRKAKEAMVNLQLIVPEDAAVRYWAKEVARARGQENEFPLIHGLPERAAETNCKKIESAIARAKTADAFFGLMSDDEELRDTVLWGLYSGVASLQSKIGVLLANCAYGYPIIRDLLLDPDYPPIPKKDIFAEVLRAGHIRVIQTVFGHEIRWFRPRMPKEIKHRGFAEAYWQVYAALGMIANDFDRKLNTAARKLYGQLTQQNIMPKTDETTIAAVLAHRSGVTGIFSTVEAVCEVFGSKSETVSAVLSALGKEKKTGSLKTKNQK